MRYFLRVAAVWIFFSLLIVGCVQSQDAAQQSGPLDLKFEALDHHIVELASYRDKQPVILFFWTTWCPHCRKEIQILNDRQEGLRKDGWAILTVDSGEPAYKVENYRDSHGITLDLFLDQDMDISNSLRVVGVPTYIIIDKKGRIVTRAHSFSPDEYKYLLTE